MYTVLYDVAGDDDDESGGAVIVEDRGSMTSEERIVRAV